MSLPELRASLEAAIAPDTLADCIEALEQCRYEDDPSPLLERRYDAALAVLRALDAEAEQQARHRAATTTPTGATP